MASRLVLEPSQCQLARCAHTPIARPPAAGVEIARALGLNYVFLCEFEELRSPLRDARSQARHGTARPLSSSARCTTAPGPASLWRCRQVLLPLPPRRAAT